jgi:hypothetical protein
MTLNNLTSALIAEASLRSGETPATGAAGVAPAMGDRKGPQDEASAGPPPRHPPACIGRLWSYGEKNKYLRN